MEYASNAKGNAALATGIIGASGVGIGLLSALTGGNNCNGNSGLLGGLFGGNNCNGGGCITQREFELQRQLDTSISRQALLEANIYNDQKSLELYQYIDGQLKDIRGELCNQRVKNQATDDAILIARNEIACTARELKKDIEIEAERRCCADNSIVNYVNATFYPKLVADVSVTATTTPQTTYNPIPRCGDCGYGCGCDN